MQEVIPSPSAYRKPPWSAEFFVKLPPVIYERRKRVICINNDRVEKSGGAGRSFERSRRKPIQGNKLKSSSLPEMNGSEGCLGDGWAGIEKVRQRI